MPTAVNIGANKTVQLKYFVLFKNSLLFDFKFYTGSTVPLDVSAHQFEFTIIQGSVQVLKIVNSDWLRPVTNEIKKAFNPFTLAVGSYKIDFTCTFSDGTIQTLATGDLVVDHRNIIS